MKLAQPFAVALTLAAAADAGAVDFARQVFPILNNKCSECHSVRRNKTKGDFAIDRQEDMQKQVKSGSPEASSLVISVTLPDDDEDVMPPKGKNRLTPAEVNLVKQWIQEGASFVAGGATPPPAPAAAQAPAQAPPAPAGVAQKWTNTAGKTIEATYEGMDGPNNVLLRVTATGVVHTVPLSTLSPESQQLARSGGK